MTLLEKLRNQINQGLEQLPFDLDQNPLVAPYLSEIEKAHRHPLLAGGKRIRPLLTLLTAGSFAGDQGVHCALPSALAVELVHTYTLVHDDLPCMDNDDLRRGLPTTHKIYGDAKALLVGDGLLAQSFLLLSQTHWEKSQNHTHELLRVLSTAAAPKGVIWGQWLDISLTGIKETNWEVMEIVHKYKTGILIAASLQLGLLCGLGTLLEEKEWSQAIQLEQKIHDCGMKIGLAFQIIDDILDATKTSKELGKTAGKDLEQNKFTAIRLLGMEKSKQISSQLTSDAMQILSEIFEEMPNKFSAEENKSYQKILFEQINNLLARPN